MEEVKLEQKPTSIFPNGEVEQIKSGYLMMPTWFLIVVLIFAFFILKSFIYHPDEKRKGK
jgi:hypothetical protein